MKHATCHPNRKHKSGGLCEPCYFAHYHVNVRKRRKHSRATAEGVVRVPVSGWGFLG